MPTDKAVMPDLPADIYYLVSQYLIAEEIESAKELFVPEEYILKSKFFDQPRIWHDLYALYFPHDLSNDHRLRRLPEAHDSWRNEFLTKYQTLSDRQKHFYSHVLGKTIISSINKSKLSSLVSSLVSYTCVNEFNLDDFINSKQQRMTFNNVIAMARILKNQEIFNLVYAACQRRGHSGNTISTIMDWNLFHLASACNQVDIIQAGLAALAAGLPSTEFANIDVRSLNNDGATPLYVAAQEGHVEVVRLLLKRGGNVDQATNRSSTPLYIAAQKGHVEVLRLLLERGAKVDQATNRSSTPLYIAAQNGHAAVMHLLLERGANVDQPYSSGATPLLIAAQNGRLDIVRLLLERGAKVDQATIAGATPLYVAAQNGYLDIVRLLLERGAKVDQATIDGATPLYIAAQKGHLDVVRLLLERGAKVDQATIAGATPLYIAAQKGHLDVVRLLLEKGANVDQADNDGGTPLYIAAQKGHIAVVRLLLKHKFENTLLTKSDVENSAHQKILASLRDEAIRRENNNGTILYYCAYLFQFPTTSFLSLSAPNLEAASSFYYRACLKGVKEALVRLKECAGSNNSNANYAKAYLCLIYLLGTNDIVADEKKAAEYFTQLSRMFTYSSFLSNRKTLDADKLIELIIGACTFSDMNEEKRQQLMLFLKRQTDVMHNKKIEELIQKTDVANPSKEPKENVVGSSQSSSSTGSSSSSWFPSRSWFWRAESSAEKSGESAAAAAAISCRNN